MLVCVGCVMCVSFGNMCTCIYCVFVSFVLCFLYCFVYVYVFLLVLSVLPPSENSVAVNNNNNNNSKHRTSRLSEMFNIRQVSGLDSWLRGPIFRGGTLGSDIVQSDR
jgi:hypothetical protein